MKKVVFIFFFTCICFYISFGQKKSSVSHEINFNAGTGMSSITKDSDIGNSFMKWGNNVGVNYNFFFSPNFGIGTGAEIAFYNNKFSGDNFHTQYLIETPAEQQSNFYFNGVFDNYSETLKTMFVNIPLLATFQIPVIEENMFYITAGVKVGIPISAKYETTYKSIKTYGYFDYTGQIYEDMPNHGFETFYDVEASGSIDLKISLTITAETGMKWNLSEKWNLYTGLFIDYGLNELRDDAKKSSPIVYNETNPLDYSYNSIFSSQSNGQYLIDKASLLAFGVKVRLAFGSK